jgi:hypothetical protein
LTPTHVDLFGYLRNTWSLGSLAKCLTDELGVPISFKHLQRIIKDLGIQCKRPKLELLHGEDYKEGRERVENHKQIASALKKKRVIVAFEDESWTREYGITYNYAKRSLQHFQSIFYQSNG